MATFAHIEDVERHNAHRTYSSQSTPTRDQVLANLDGANERLTAELMASKVPVNDTSFHSGSYPELWIILREVAALEAAMVSESQTRSMARDPLSGRTHVDVLKDQLTTQREMLFTRHLARFSASLKPRPWSAEVDEESTPLFERDDTY